MPKWWILERKGCECVSTHIPSVAPTYARLVPCAGTTVPMVVAAFVRGRVRRIGTRIRDILVVPITAKYRVKNPVNHALGRVFTMLRLWHCTISCAVRVQHTGRRTPPTNETTLRPSNSLGKPLSTAMIIPHIRSNQRDFTPQTWSYSTSVHDQYIEYEY